MKSGSEELFPEKYKQKIIAVDIFAKIFSSKCNQNYFSSNNNIINNKYYNKNLIKIRSQSTNKDNYNNFNAFHIDSDSVRFPIIINNT